VYLGRWWKKLQKYGTYAIAALLGIHLALLEGFGFAQGDGFGVAHQRLYEYTACIIPLVVWRMPVVRRLYKTHNRIAWVLTAVLLAMFITGMTFFVNELVFKGYQAFTMHPVED
jgi:hypothetical protein